MYEGNEVYANFEPRKRELTGNWTSQGKGICYRSKRMAIMTVAGIEYASWVEEVEYDVITGPTLGAKLKMDKA